MQDSFNNSAVWFKSHKYQDLSSCLLWIFSKNGQNSLLRIRVVDATIRFHILSIGRQATDRIFSHSTLTIPNPLSVAFGCLLHSFPIFKRSHCGQHMMASTYAATRHEIGESLGSPRDIMEFSDDEAEASRHFMQQRFSGSINLSSTTSSEALTTSSPSAPPHITRLKPRHDCNNSLWNHRHLSNANANANANGTRTQVSKPTLDGENDYINTDQELTLELQAEAIPTNLLLPLDFWKAPSALPSSRVVLSNHDL